MISLEDLSKVCIKLLLKEPFYGHYISGVPKEISTETETAAVALYRQQMIKLIVNAAFWHTLTDEKRYGLIKHEILHIVFKHLFTFKNYENKFLFNIAADLVVNQYITKEQLPNGGITIERFENLSARYNIDLKPNMDVGYYYRKLSKILQHLPKFPSGNKNISDQFNESDFSDLLRGDHQELQKHYHWKAIAGLSPAEISVMKKLVEANLKQAVQRVKNKNYGNLPAGLIEKLKGFIAAMEPVFNWKRIFRLFATTSNSTYIKNTIRRPSKRYGTTPGIKVKRRNRLLVAIDTSGSVNQHDLKEFFGEIYHIWRQGAEIEVVECDTLIQQTYKYKGITPVSVKGRGGTDFNAPLQYANDIFRPDAVIYFTDGYAPAPKVSP